MINLLPPEAQTKIKRLYWMRVITLGLFLWGAVSLILTALLFPVYVLVQMQISSFSSTEKELTARVLDYDKYLAELAEAGNLAKHLLSSSQSRFVVYNQAINQAAVGKVTLTDLKYNFEEPTSVSLSGVAITRDSLIDFRDLLADQKYFSEVNLPIDFVTQTTDIDFSITMQLSPDLENVSN